MAAIAAATSVNMPTTEDPTLIRRIMCIGTDGQPHAITPLTLIKYVMETLVDYDVIARPKPSNS